MLPSVGQVLQDPLVEEPLGVFSADAAPGANDQLQLRAPDDTEYSRPPGAEHQISVSPIDEVRSRDSLLGIVHPHGHRTAAATTVPQLAELIAPPTEDFTSVGQSAGMSLTGADGDETGVAINVIR